MKTCNDITLISTYWNELKAACERINNELPNIEGQTPLKSISKNVKFAVVNYSDLKNWSATDMFNPHSKGLTALADKIRYMVNKGDAPNIVPMLNSMCFKGIKKQSRPDAYGKNEFLGHGHFRWNHGFYKLSDIEIERIKEYFKLTE